MISLKNKIGSSVMQSFNNIVRLRVVVITYKLLHNYSNIADQVLIGDEDVPQ